MALPGDPATLSFSQQETDRIHYEGAASEESNSVVGDNLVLIKMEPLDSDNGSQLSHNSDLAQSSAGISGVSEEDIGNEDRCSSSMSGCGKLPVSIMVEPELIIKEEVAQEFSCFYCLRTWKTLALLRKHIKVKHSSLYRRFTASCITENRSDFVDIQNQLKNNHLISIAPYNAEHYEMRLFQCPLCDYSTKREDHLKRHTDAIHNFEKPFSCPYCEHRSAWKHHLQDHIMSKHTEYKRFQCPSCDYMSVRKRDLQLHIRSKHTNERRFQCPHCDHRSIRKHDLQEHITSRHTNDRRFQCPHCDYRSFRKQVLQQHISSKHTREKPFQCSFCDYRCSRKKDVLRHTTAKHTNEKHFVCPHCENRFAWKSGLLQHIMYKHTSERPFSCPHCDFACVQKSKLKRHVIRQHNIKTHS